MSTTTWKEKLADTIEPGLFREIEIFEKEIELKRQGKIDDAVFAETRLRRGAYGQRYDNGLRHDGVEQRRLEYPSGTLSKGASTLWDAPGMQRIKIPFGGVTPEQMETLADLAEEYSDGICHITTRQDVQLHYVHIEDVPELSYRLAAAGITTREACGNTIRNVTACPYAGVCTGELFDVTPYAKSLARYLLGHSDAQDFGRKFKIAFSGCEGEACALANMHDLGFIAKTWEENGAPRRGFDLYAGGGLGAVPFQAKLFARDLPEEEIFPLAQAICRVFARLGEKKNRARARMKFLVEKLGLEEFKRLVLEERRTLPEDPRWKQSMEEIRAFGESPSRTGEPLIQLPSRIPGFDAWRRSNVRPQRQAGYAVATVALPLGDISSEQLRGLAEVARRFAGDTTRFSVEQNIVLRWVSDSDLPQLYEALRSLGLAEAGAGSMADITACPGTDTCKLGIASSRGLAGEIRHRLSDSTLDPGGPGRDLRVKISGCFNSCGQHHIADLGFYGVSRKKDGHVVPHFQVVLGGMWSGNAGAFGLAIGAVPSKRVPQAIERIVGCWTSERTEGETLQAFVQRVGKAKIKSLLDDLTELPSSAEDPSLYSDWGDPRRYSTGDLGKGECAGAVVPIAEFGLTASEREAFEAQLHLDAGRIDDASRMAYRAMLTAAKALLQTKDPFVRDEPEELVGRFRAEFYDTQLFFDPFAKGKFAQYLFRVHGQPLEGVGPDQARQRVEEASLFIEAAHACYLRLGKAA